MARTKQTARKSTGGRARGRRLAHRMGEPQHFSAHESLEDSMDTADSMEQPEEIPSYGPARDWEDEWMEEPQEEPQEDDIPEDQEEPEEQEPPVEEAAPEEEEPMYRKAMTYRNSGGAGGQAPGQLRGLLQKLGVNHVPEYVIKIVPRPGRDVYTARVDIYDHDRLLSTHFSPTPRLTEGAVVADTAWEAITFYSYGYRHRLTGSVFSLFPRRRSGHGDYTLAPLPDQVPRSHVTYREDMIVRLCDRLQSALGEIRTLEERLEDTEATLRAHMRVQQGAASDLYSSGIRTWSAASTDRGHPEYPLAENPPTGRTPSPSSPSDEGSRS